MDAFKRAGTLGGHFEVFMNTQNTGALKDDYAFGHGGGLKFEKQNPLWISAGLERCLRF